MTQEFKDLFDTPKNRAEQAEICIGAIGRPLVKNGFLQKVLEHRLDAEENIDNKVTAEEMAEETGLYNRALDLAQASGACLENHDVTANWGIKSYPREIESNRATLIIEVEDTAPLAPPPPFSGKILQDTPPPPKKGQSYSF